MIDKFLQELHDQSPEQFVHLLSEPSRIRAVRETPSKRLLDDLQQVAERLAEIYGVSDTFFQSRANCYLFTALADVYEDWHHNTSSGRAKSLYRFASTAGPLIVGRDGSQVVDVIDSNVEQLLRAHYGKGNVRSVSDEQIERDTRVAVAGSRLAVVRELRAQKAILEGRAGAKLERQSLDGLSILAQSHALRTTMRTVTAEHFGSLREFFGVSQLPTCDWVVVPDEQFDGVRSTMLSVPAVEDSNAAVFVGASTAKRVIKNQMTRIDPSLLKDQYYRAVSSSAGGLDRLLGGVGDDFRFVCSNGEVGSSLHMSTWEDTLLEVTLAVGRPGVGAAAMQASHMMGAPARDTLVEGTVASFGLRHALLFSMLSSSHRLDHLVSHPDIDGVRAQDKYGAFVKSLSRRTERVFGWPSLVDSVTPLLMQIDRSAGDSDNYRGVDPRKLHQIFRWDHVGDRPDATKSVSARREVTLPAIDETFAGRLF